MGAAKLPQGNAQGLVRAILRPPSPPEHQPETTNLPESGGLNPSGSQYLKKTWYILLIILIVSFLSVIRQNRVIKVEASQFPSPNPQNALNEAVVKPQRPPSRPEWPYLPENDQWIVPTDKMSEVIHDLIMCESRGVSVKRIDSNNYYSYGILQFQSSTWNGWSKVSGIQGDPMVPDDAIKMATWALGHGLIKNWSCSRILGIIQ